MAMRLKQKNRVLQEELSHRRKDLAASMDVEHGLFPPRRDQENKPPDLSPPNLQSSVSIFPLVRQNRSQRAKESIEASLLGHRVEKRKSDNGSGREFRRNSNLNFLLPKHMKKICGHRNVKEIENTNQSFGDS